MTSHFMSGNSVVTIKRGERQPAGRSQNMAPRDVKLLLLHYTCVVIFIVFNFILACTHVCTRARACVQKRRETSPSIESDSRCSFLKEAMNNN